MGQVIRLGFHKWESHTNCRAPHPCYICDGGLSVCTICRGAEAELPTSCPGEVMHELVCDEVVAGRLDYKVGVGWYLVRQRKVEDA